MNYMDVRSIFISTHKDEPVMFIGANQMFSQNACEKLGIPTVFQHGKNYYNPDNGSGNL